MSNVIQTVGAFAGLAAIFGVAVLGFLVISQARDLRRLREWAGGAPERDAEVRQVSELVAEERSEELKLLADREQRRIRRESGLEPGFWERLGRSGQIMVVIAAVILVGAAAAWYLTSQSGDTGKVATQGKSKKAGSGSVSNGDIRVAVLNGTGGAESGLAAEYADFLDQKGFSVGVTSDAPETYEDSVVFFTAGNPKAAAKVASAIDAPTTELVPSEIAAIAPEAETIAVIGTNHSDLPSSG